MSNERTIHRIDPVPQGSNEHNKTPTIQRVAAYARVSTDSEDQLASSAAQVDYYTQYVQSRQSWTLIGIYLDEGISGTSTKKREGFTCMVQDALGGKIDLIITKSISRFARNTVDTLTTIRKLKERNVEVFFEKENIYTFDSKGEFLITLLSSLAQEESRTISENVAWGIRKRMADGKINLPYAQFLGYEKGEDNLPMIIGGEAAIVRKIFGMFIKGHTPYRIANLLSEEGIPSPSGKSKWESSVIRSILSNEKYMGEAILQKTYTADFLTRKKKPNKGELPQYHVKKSHPAIISKDVFLYVQDELDRRKAENSTYLKSHDFSSKIICGMCGNYYGSFTWHATNKYRTIVWQCRKRWQKPSPCRSPHLYDRQIKDAFVELISKLFQDDLTIAQSCRQIVLSTIGQKNKMHLEQAEAFFNNLELPFDEDLFCALVDSILVQDKHTLVFRLRTGDQICIVV